MKKYKYNGFFGKWFIPFVFLVTVVINLYFVFLKTSEAAGWILFISFLFITIFAIGLIEGRSIGRNTFIEDMEKDPDTRNIYLKRFNNID